MIKKCQPIRAARAQQTATDILIAHQPLVGGIKQKDFVQASTTKSEKELLIATKSKTTQVGKRKVL